jgi:aryl-alcohol dehydrogenase-like predicted oxidoreductase
MLISEENMKRVLGKSGIETSALGMGCWAIGGPWTLSGNTAGWGKVDDAESERAIKAALDCGANFFDTAANYGCGHSERILGRALKGKRDKVVIATKFGYDVDEDAKEVRPYGPVDTESDVARHVRADLEKSLRRLGTDYVDVYLLHVWGLSVEKALPVRDELEALVREGKIRTYGWSTDRTDAVRAFSILPGCAVVEQQLNVFECDPSILALCEELDLASINRGPLGMGILTGKFKPDSSFGADDVRHSAAWIAGMKDGRPKREWLDALDAIRGILTSGGRTLAQGSLAWIWGRSGRAIPIPGFRTVKQVEENCKAMDFGPLDTRQMAEIESILKR